MLVRTLHARAALLATLLATILTSPAARAGSCSGGGVSSDPAPLVDALRSYRAGFVAPTRVAADSADNLYIADPSRGRIVVREPSGRIATVMENLGHPLSVAVSTERVFVGDGVDGSVAAYSPDWQFLFWLGQGPGEFGRPGDIAVDPGSGNVWVSDTPANHVRLYGPAGDLIRTVGGPGAGDESRPHGSVFSDTSG